MTIKVTSAKSQEKPSLKTPKYIPLHSGTKCNKKVDILLGPAGIVMKHVVTKNIDFSNFNFDDNNCIVEIKHLINFCQPNIDFLTVVRVVVHSLTGAAMPVEQRIFDAYLGAAPPFQTLS